MGSKRAINLLRNIKEDFKMHNQQIRSAVDFVKVTATVTLNLADSGKVHIIGPLVAGLAADTIITLPSAEAGLMFEFHYVGGAADAQDFQLSTGSDTNFYIGGIHQHDIGGEDGAAYHPNLSSNSRINFLTPDAGTWAKVYCDGTNWFVTAFLSSATNTGVTFADQ